MNPSKFEKVIKAYRTLEYKKVIKKVYGSTDPFYSYYERDYFDKTPELLEVLSHLQNRQCSEFYNSNYINENG